MIQTAFTGAGSVQALFETLGGQRYGWDLAFLLAFQVLPAKWGG